MPDPSQFFTEDNGSKSCMRLVFVLVVVVVLFNWTWFNIKSGQFVPLDWTTALTVVGMGWAKATQKGNESKLPAINGG